MQSSVPGAALRIGQLVAEFDTVAPLDAAALRLAGRTLLDTLGCALAGSRDPVSGLALAYARSRGAGGAAIWRPGPDGQPLRAAEEDAAWANGVSAHVLDYDDVTGPMLGHPSVAMWPAILACAETEGLPLARAHAAFAAGFEVICRVSRAVALGQRTKGWHTTGTLGALGAAAACCHLLRLSPRQTASALALVVSQTGGTRENFGTAAKSVQAGHANLSGLRAARLAALGIDGSPDALDGPSGWTVLTGEGQSLQGIFDGWGSDPPELVRWSVDVKKYPMCYAAHRAADLVLGLRAQHGLDLARVARAQVRVTGGGMAALIHPRPRTALDAKFSMQYAVAAALADGRLGLTSFTDDQVLRPGIQAFLERVSAEEGAGPPKPFWAEVRLFLADGAELHAKTHSLRGSAQDPLSDAELEAKVEDCLAYAGLRADVARLGELCRAPAAAPVSALWDVLFRRPPR